MIPHEEILDRIGVGVVVQDAETRILYSNPAARDLLGLDAEALHTRSSLDPEWRAVRPDGSPFPGPEHPVPRSIESGEPVTDVVMGLWNPAREERIWLLVSALPVEDPAGRVHRVVATFTDVSVEHAVQEQLRGTLEESESGYSAVIEAMAEGVAIHASDGRIISANPAAEKILGITLGQMQGRHAVDPRWRLSRPDGSDLPPEEIPSEVTRLTGEPCRNVVLRVRRSSGEEAWLSVNTVPIGDPRDGPPEVIATFTDITREREVRHALQASRDRLRRITETVPGVIMECVVRSDGSIRFPFVSGRCEALLGVQPRTVVEDPDAAWTNAPQEHRQRVKRELARTMGEGRAVELEFPVESDETGKRWIDLSSSEPTETPNGVLSHLILLDVTEKRRMAQVLYETQRQEGLGTLAAGIAHNFNNMLAAIVPPLERLLTSEPASLHDEIEDAFRAALGASELVRQLMTVAGRSTVTEEERVDLVEVVEEVARLCRRTFDPRIRIETDLPEGGAFTAGIRSELQQVLLNLAVNARDALSGRPDPEVRFSLRRGDDHFRIDVRDNGAGMSAQVQERLCEPFFTTKEPGKGTGLGLASARGILRNRGGDLTWSSTVGEGSTFTVLIPARALPDVTDAEGDEGSEAEISSAGPVLVVDDEEMVRRTVARVLRRAGVETVEVAGGREALDLLDARDDIELVMLDRSMPGLSGIEVLEQIRARWSDLPVVLMSGYLHDEDVLDAVTHTVQKPMRAATLHSIVRKALEG